jgi:hypothetical protein
LTASGENLHKVLLRIGERARLLQPASPAAQRELAEQMIEEVANNHPDRLVAALLANKRKYVMKLAEDAIAYNVRKPPRARG